MQSKHTYTIRAQWDADARVWYVSESDVPGLAAEAETPEKLIDLLSVFIPELIEANGANGTPEVPFQLMLHNLMARHARA